MTVLRIKILLVCAFVSLTAAVPVAVGDWNPGDAFKMHFPQLPDTNVDGVHIPVGTILDSITIEQQWLDFGDAPDPNYPTLLANGGARHVIAGPFFCDLQGGDAPDPEPDGQPEGQAQGDDNNDGNDDEDGVSVPATLQQLRPDNIRVHVCGGGGVVQIWIDYNGDEDWDDTGEDVFSGFLPDGGHNIPVTALAGSFTGFSFARCRISTAGGLLPTGQATDGEVEDHRTYIGARDYGDAPDPNYRTLWASNGASHEIVSGAPWLGPADDRPDADLDGQPDAAALGDDGDAEGDDEDGVTIPPLTVGAATNIDVEVSGGGGWVYGWIDFNADGDWDDPCELVVIQNLPDGVNPIAVTAPAGSATGITFARFRISSSSLFNASPTGLWNNGEVEDHRVEILPPPGNDCSDPVLVTPDWEPGPYTNTTCGRGDNYNDTCLGNYDGGEDIIYQLNVMVGGNYKIVLDPCGTPDTGIAIDDSCPPDNSCLAQSTIQSSNPHGFCVTLAQGTYYVMIDTWPTPDCIPEFTLTVELSGPPGNDDCANAEAVGDVVDQPFDTICATFDGGGGCMTGPNIWYCYTATCTGYVTVSLCGSGYDTRLAVYNGCACYPTLGDMIDCNDNFCGLQSQITFWAADGNDYLIEVGGFADDTGPGLLSIWCEELVCDRGDYIDTGSNQWTCPDANFVFGSGDDGCLTEIPADFFGPGSDPFDGAVSAMGHDPLSDTTILRTAQGHVPPPFPSSDTIPIELLELNLQSTDPIVVTYNGGMDPEEWDVTVDLSIFPPPWGTLNATKTHCNGGTYTSELSVQPRFTFTKSADPCEVRVFDTGFEGVPPIDLNSVGPCAWEHSPDGNDFRPASDCPLELADGNGCSMTLVPSDTAGDHFWVQVGLDDANGGGSGYNGGHWYYYPNTDWWNQWFYDHRFDADRKKVIDVSFTIRPLDPCQPSWAKVAYNWATPHWPDPCRPPLPPLDPNDEDVYIGRSIFFEDDLATWPQFVQHHFEIAEYNPAWISIDVNGYNFEIISGWIDHACIPKEPVEPWEPKPPVPHLKWSQPPIEIDPTTSTAPLYCGWDEPSYTDDPCGLYGAGWRIVADDFRCLGAMPVTSVHWWGSYVYWEEPCLPPEEPNAWRIGFWSNMAADPLADPNFSRPDVLLWQIEVSADRVQTEWAGYDMHPMFPQDTCFQHYVQLEPEEYFWQSDYEIDTQDNVFWLSIAALYQPGALLENPWGWKTRPWSWMDDAVWFDLEEAPWLGMPLDPWLVNPIQDPLTYESFDVAFELDTDPNYIKWEQAYDSIRHWPHYEDILSMTGPVTETKWRQLPDPNGWDVGFGIYTGLGSLADDWVCTETGPLSDIHFWCSWRGDAAGPIQQIEVSIYSDDPCGPGGHSEPNQQLWWRRFLPGQFTVSWAGEGDQGWLYHSGLGIRPDHNNFFRIDIEDINEPFVQQEGNIYWLNIYMFAEGQVGLKTSLDHWNDNAVYADMDTWNELTDPCGGGPLDFAFEIGTRKDYGLRAQAADDWRCDRNTPVTAAVWWGSYIGYQYQACADPLMAAPVTPDAFLLSVWTDVAAGADPCYPFSHPGEMIWEYRADDYDEVLVGYDKHPHGQPNEPVFRYSVRLGEDDWFLQEEVDGIYWFSVVAAYDQNIPNYDWGWTNHEQYYNDNAVTGRLEPSPGGGWKWYELYDQTGEGADMSFILFTEPDPNLGTCWDPAECPCQPQGDCTCNGLVNFGDLFCLKSHFGKCAPWVAPECCADFTQNGCINFGDLFALKTSFGLVCPLPSTGNQKCP